MDETLSDILKDPSRPAFLFGSTPPRDGGTEEKAKATCAKFAARSAVLATDGFIVYDIQDEDGRTEKERPFPFRKTMDAALYASYFKPLCAKECVVYKCVSCGHNPNPSQVWDLLSNPPFTPHPNPWSLVWLGPGVLSSTA
jgi:hypothetical protein